MKRVLIIFVLLLAGCKHQECTDVDLVRLKNYAALHEYRTVAKSVKYGKNTRYDVALWKEDHWYSWKAWDYWGYGETLHEAVEMAISKAERDEKMWYEQHTEILCER